MAGLYVLIVKHDKPCVLLLNSYSRNRTAYCFIIIIIRPCRSSDFSVDDLSVCVSICPVRCGKMADRIRMPFSIIGRTGPRMRQVMGFGDLSTGRGTFWGEFGAHHCNQWGLYGIRVRQCLNRRSRGLGWCVRWAEALLY